MDSVKVFEGGDGIAIQKKIDDWVEREKPIIKNSSVAVSPYHKIVISVTYQTVKK